MEIKIDLNDNEILSWTQMKQRPGLYHVLGAADDFYLMSINDGTVLYIRDPGMSLAKEHYWINRKFQPLFGTLAVKF